MQMAYNNFIFVIAVIYFSSNINLVGHAQVLPGGLSVLGNLCCMTTGNCPGTALSGALVTLNCSTALLGASAAVLGQNITDINGRFNITIPNVLGLLNTIGILPCNVVVQLPLNRTVCLVLSTANGLLIGTVQSVGTLLTQALGLVQNVIVSAFLRFSI